MSFSFVRQGVVYLVHVETGEGEARVIVEEQTEETEGVSDE